MKSDIIKYIIIIIVLAVLSSFLPISNDIILNFIIFFCGLFLGEHMNEILNFFKKRQPDQ
jgi:hypothetical protein